MDEIETEDDFTRGLGRIMDARSLKPAPFSVAAGLGQTAVRDLFRKGSSPKISTAKAIADYLGMTVDDVIMVGRTGIVSASSGVPVVSDVSWIDRLSVSASAGPGALVGPEDVIDRLAFPAAYMQMITSSKPKWLKIISVQGSSMLPTLAHGDLVMVDMSKDSLTYEGIFVIQIDHGGALLVKRIGRATKKGYVMVISDNPQHRDVEMAMDDIHVVGKVIWAGVKYD